MRKPGSAVFAALLLSTYSATAGAAESLHLVTPVVYGTHLAGLGSAALDFAKRVKQLSAGALLIELKQPGDGAQPQEILDKVSAGSVNAGFSTGSFWAAKIPAAALFSGFPFGPDAQGYVDWFYAGNGLKLYQEMYDQAGYKVHVIPCAFGGAEASGWFAKEIHTLDDLKGLRMRVLGLAARVMSKAGVTPVLVSGANLGDALDKHQVDAGELYTPAVDRAQGLAAHAKLVYAPGWHQPETVLEFLVNKDRWAALDDQQQTELETACQATMLRTMAENSKLQRDALAELAAKDGVRVEPWPPDVLSAFRAAWAEVAKEEGDRDVFFKEVLDDLAKFQAKTSDAGTAPPSP